MHSFLQHLHSSSCQSYYPLLSQKNLRLDSQLYLLDQPKFLVLRICINRCLHYQLLNFHQLNLNSSTVREPFLRQVPMISISYFFSKHIFKKILFLQGKNHQSSEQEYSSKFLLVQDNFIINYINSVEFMICLLILMALLNFVYGYLIKLTHQIFSILVFIVLILH